MNFVAEMGEKVLNGGAITKEEALQLLQVKGSDIYLLAAYAGKVREKFTGNKVDLCSIVNAKSGNCSEDCSFCAQSAHHCTPAPIYNLLPIDEMVKRAIQMEKEGAHHFDIVISGKGVKYDDPEFQQILEAFRQIRKATKIQLCACLGTLDEKAAQALVEVGVTRYNHNLETARSFFPNVVSTHTYDERIDTIRTVKKAGMEACCGGIVGLGETPEQRVEMAFTLRELDVDAVPINVLNPISGTKLEGQDPLTPMEVVKIFGVFRLILPGKNIRFAGGREVNLRDVQSLGLMGGINGMLIGNYLTTHGRDVKTDLKMIRDMGMDV